MPLFPRLLLFASLSLDLRVGADGKVTLGGEPVDCTADPPKGAQPTRLVIADGAPGSALSCALGLLGSTEDYDVAWEGASPGIPAQSGATLAEIDPGALHVLVGEDRLAVWRDDPARAVVLPDVDGKPDRDHLHFLIYADFTLDRRSSVVLDERRNLPPRAHMELLTLLAKESRNGEIIRGDVGPLPDPPLRPTPTTTAVAAAYRVDTHANLVVTARDGTQTLIPYATLAGFELACGQERCVLVARTATGTGWALGGDESRAWRSVWTPLMGRPVWATEVTYDLADLPALDAVALPKLPWGAAPTEGPVIDHIERRSDIDRVIKAHLPEFRTCYERMLGRDPTLAGKVTVKAVIARDGYVSMAVIKASTLNNVEVESCIANRFMKMSFPPPSDGKPLTFSYPFLFST